MAAAANESRGQWSGCARERSTAQSAAFARSEWNFIPDDASLSAPHIDVRVLVGAKQVTDFHLVELAARVGARLTSFDVWLSDALAPADRHHVRVITGCARSCANGVLPSAVNQK